MPSTLVVFPPLSSNFSAAASSPQFGVRNGHRLINFDDTTVEQNFYTGVMPLAYAGAGLTAEIEFLAATAIVGDVVWGISFERASTDFDADSFAAEITVTQTTGGTSGIPTKASIAFTNSQIDGLFAGEQFRIRLRRVATDAADTMVGDAQASTVAFIQQSGGGGGGGFFQDGVGTDAAVGKGVVAPLAGGSNSLAQGNASNAILDNSIAIGDTNVVEGLQAGAFGKNNTIGTSGFGSRDSWALGYGNTIGLSAGENFTFGRNNTVAASQAFNVITGEGNTGNGTTSLMGGFGNTVAGYVNMAFGYSNDILASDYCIAFGGYNDIAASQHQSFAFGKLNTVTGGGGNVLVAGFTNSLNRQESLVVGANNTVNGYGDAIGVVGSDNEVGSYNYCSLVVGRTNKAGKYGYGWLIVGDICGAASSTTGYSGIGAIAVGQNLTFGATSSNGTILCGSAITLTDGHEANLWVGRNLVSGASATHNMICVGIQNQIDGATSCIAHGIRAHALRDKQRAFSAGRNTSIGDAQWSFLVEHLQTTNATQTTMLTFPLEEDQGYAFRALLVAFNTTTNAECAALELSTTVGLRNTGGAAVMGTAPTAFTNSDNTGGNSTSFAAQLNTSTNDLIVQVTGVAAQTVKWTLKLEFSEVTG